MLRSRAECRAAAPGAADTAALDAAGRAAPVGDVDSWPDVGAASAGRAGLAPGPHSGGSRPVTGERVAQDAIPGRRGQSHRSWRRNVTARTGVRSRVVVVT